MQEPFWTPKGTTPETADFVIYDAEHQTGEREVLKDRSGNYRKGWFFGEYTYWPAEAMPEWAEREQEAA